MLDGDGQMSVDAGSLLDRILILQSDRKANASLDFQVFSSFFKFLFDILPFRNYITKHDPADASTVGPTPRKGRFFFRLDQSLGARQLLLEDYTNHNHYKANKRC